jgi:hypothetical protein
MTTADIIPVLVCTAHRGVFAGLMNANETFDKKSIALKSARMAIKFGTTNGILELAHTGPTTKSKISAPADCLMLNDITAVFNITDEAWAAWSAA